MTNPKNQGDSKVFINKRLLIIIAIASIIILGSLGFVTALVLTQSNANATTSSATPTPTPPASTPHATANRICATGAIQSIDTQNQTFTVTETKGKKTITVTANSQTTYHKRN